jgi:transcriptional regulator with XRE-family HTH domain/cellobiose-specific phosphotransferase system component IIA
VTETVGERIRRLRRERGLTLRDLAVPGVSYTYLSRVESGQRTPSVRAIRQLARGLGVSAEYLESGVELSAREELDLALADLQLALRLEPDLSAELEHRFRKLIHRADAQAEEYHAARARAALGVYLAGQGRLAEAIELIEAALAYPFATPGVFTEAYGTLAASYIHVNEEQRAVEFCERALALTPPEDTAVRLTLVTHLSAALADLGQLERAQEVLNEVAVVVREADPYSRARLHWSQARVATARGKRQLALRHMQKAIMILEGTEDTIRLARSHLVSALILLWGGRTDGAEQHLEAARALLPPHAGPEDHGQLLALEALLAAHEHRLDDALERSAGALLVLGEHGPGQAAALYARALAQARRGFLDEANADFIGALELLERAHMMREASMVAREQAKARRTAGDDAGAREALARADELAAR